MKKLLFIFLIPIFSFTQSGDTNGDGFVNLEDLFNVLENWLQNVNDNDPEAISNLDEMTSLVDSLITLNQNINYGRGYDMFFPDGFGDLEPIQINLNDAPYDIPDGRNLYITHAYANGGSNEILLNNQTSLFEHTGAFTHKGQMPFIISGSNSISVVGNSILSGFLVNRVVESKHINLSDSIYIVPVEKNLHVFYSHSDTDNAEYKINDETVMYGGGGQFYEKGWVPLILKAGDVLSASGGGSYNIASAYLVDEDYFSSVSTSNSNNIQSSLENNTSIQVNDSDYYDFNDCNYINSLDYGSIVHSALQGLTAVVLPGKQCGSTPTSMFTFTSSGTNSFDTRDFLWCFSVNDTIALTTIPALNSGGATNLYLLEDSLTNYDPNTDCEADSDQFIYGSVQNVMYSLLPKEVILLPENIYGLRMDGSGGSNTSYMHYGVSIQTTETINNLGLWENQYPDYEWQLTNYFPLIGSPAYYPYGKRFKYF